MKAATNLFTALMVLAIAQTLTKALCIVLLIFSLLGAVAAPRQTFGLIALLGLLTLAHKKPAYSIAALGAVGVVVAAASRCRPEPDRSATPLLLSCNKSKASRNG